MFDLGLKDLFFRVFFQQTLFLLSRPPVLVTHFHLGEEEVSLKKMFGSYLLGGPVLIFAWGLDGGRDWLLWPLFFGTFGLAIIQRAYTKRQERLGNPQYSNSFGVPFLALLGLPFQFSRYLSLLIPLGVAWFLAPTLFISSIWLGLGSVWGLLMMIIGNQTATEKQRKLKDAMLEAVEMEEQESLMRAQQAVNRRRMEREMPVQVDPAQETHTAAPIMSASLSPARKGKPSDHGGLLDN